METVRLPPAPHLLTGAFCAGLAGALAVRTDDAWLAGCAASAVLGALALDRRRVLVLALGLVLLGTWWGSSRLAALDGSVLAEHVGEAEPASLEVTGPVRRSEYTTRVPVRVRRFGD